MVALYDILHEAQGGQALDTIGRQYGLTPEQTEAALQALIPAFSEGLQRSASTPDGIRTLLGVLSEQQDNRAFDEPLAAFGDQGRQTGNDVLAALFGSKDVSRAVAMQAADFSGIAPEILKKMLPTIANVVISGLIRNMLGGRGGRSGGGGLGDLIGGMLGGGGARQETRRAPSPRSRTRSDRDDDSPGGGGGFLDEKLGGGGGRSAPRARRGGDSNSLEDIFGPAAPGLGDGSGGDANPAGSGSGRSAGGSLIDILGDLLLPGKQVPEQNRRGMESIFDGFFGPKRQ